MELADAIREGDGDRVHRCWKYLLPIFKASNRTNYSIEVLNMLNQVEFVLTEREAAELLWNRFVNTHGVRGRNIPCDLHIEHLNRMCKDAVYGLQANKTPTAIVRISKSLGPLANIIESYDKENRIKSTSGAHNKPSFNKEMTTILKELMKYKVFVESDRPRKYDLFPTVKVSLHEQDREELLLWMMDHM